ncbi:MAG: glycerate kinase [Rhizobiaceae bacterium]|nr:glycerate kinase [Rhizobiaceae bacterium]
MTKPIEPVPFLTSLFDAAVDAAQPEKVITRFLPEKPKGRLVIIGAGKGSAQMGRAFEQAWMEKHGEAVEGVIVTRYGYACDCEHLEVLEAAHPVPDEAGLVGAQRLLDAVADLSENDLVVALISGGGSALLPAPPEGLTLADEIAVNETLLASGAPISAMNTVRKHVSLIKGGRLAAVAYPAKTVSLLVSDIPGDHPQFIASGPTVADEGSREDALAIIDQYKMPLPDAVLAHVKTSAADAPLPTDAALSKAEHHIIASAAISLEVAQALAQSHGIETHILSDAIEGEAREAARTQAAIAKEILHRDRPFKKPVLLLSGGETTVTLKGNGRGGRNTEFLLSFAIEIAGEKGVHLLSADTDGIDGSENNAGAFVDGDTAGKMRMAGIDPVAYLQNNDAYTAFDKIGALFIPGPTGTNVNDFRAILITG